MFEQELHDAVLSPLQKSSIAASQILGSVVLHCPGHAYKCKLSCIKFINHPEMLELMSSVIDTKHCVVWWKSLCVLFTDGVALDCLFNLCGSRCALLQSQQYLLNFYKA